MILKVLDYQKDKDLRGTIKEWNYFDNIESASSYFDEEHCMATVRCVFRNKSVITFSIPYVGYLMDDEGKTIEKIFAPYDEERGDTFENLQDAVEFAMSESLS